MGENILNHLCVYIYIERDRCTELFGQIFYIHTPCVKEGESSTIGFEAELLL